MESLFFHPKMVHLPLALGMLLPLASFAIALAWWRRWLPAKTWWLAVALQALLVTSAFAAMQTGEREEHAVERVIDEAVIHEHEEAAEAFLWTAAAVFGVMLVAGALIGRRPALPLAALACAGTLIAAGLGMRAGHEGGELVYEHGAADAYRHP